jgi:type IV secretion system protein VirD4
MADEIRRMDRGLQVALIGNLRPAILQKTPYWKQGALRGRYHPNPYYGGKTPGPGLGAPFATLQTAILRLLIFWLAPHPVAACTVCAAIVGAGLALFGGGAF